MQIFDTFKRATNTVVGLVNRAGVNNNRAVAALAPQEVQANFLAATHRCANRDFVIGSLSEASVLFSRSRFLTLARGVGLADGEKSDIVLFDIKSNRIINHGGEPQNLGLHRLIYTHSSFESVLLCHPKYSIRNLAKKQELDFSLLPSVESKIGQVVTCELGDLEKSVSNHTVIFVRDVGVLSLGNTLDQALERIELLEWICWQNLFDE